MVRPASVVGQTPTEHGLIGAEIRVQETGVSKLLQTCPLTAAPESCLLNCLDHAEIT